MDNKDMIERVILSYLVHNPELLFEEKYPLKAGDFKKKIHKQIYSALLNIYARGVTNINIEEIKMQIGKSSSAGKEFVELGGDSRLSEIDNLNWKVYDYDIQYANLKKYALFQDLEANGIDISDLYHPEGDAEKAMQMADKIDKMSYKDIIDHYREKVAKIEDKYENFIEKSGIEAGEGLDDLLHSLEEQPEMGMPLIGDLLNVATRGARRKKVYLNSAGSGTGKALVNGSKVMTPNGPKSIEDMVIGDSIFGEDGKIYKVLGVFPQGEKEVYRITFNDRTFIDCCDEHLWTFQTASQRGRKSKKWSTKTLKEIIDTVPLKIKSSIGKVKTPYRWNIFIPITAPIDYKEQETKIKPYSVGALLGDGYLRLAECPTFTNKNLDIVQRVERELKDINVSLSKHKNSNCEYDLISYDELKEELYNLDLGDRHSWDKFIPDVYKYNTIENRIKLLQGLFDADGSVSGGNTVDITLKSKQLILDIKEICESLGLTATYYEKENTGYYLGSEFVNCGTTYRLNVKMNKEIGSLFYCEEKNNKIKNLKKTIYRNIHKIEKLNKKEPMTCITTSNPTELFLTNNYIVTHNSRMAAGNVAKLGFPMYYDEVKEQWIETGMQCPILFITTELEHSEVQTMFISYVSGVNEEKILNNKYDTMEEKKRVQKAVEIIKKCHNVYIEFIPEPSIDSVAAKIRLYALQKEVEYVFYDYIHVSSATYKNKKDMRDDVWLMLFVDKLKQLANELDIHISTATQLNASSYEDKEIKNESMIRGAKSIADKVDFAMITTAILKEQEKSLAKSLATTLGTREPNQILDIYKNRRGKWRSIRIWRYTDLGTCRSFDCFATDTGNNPIDIKITKTIVSQLVKEGSFPVVNPDTGEVVEENRKMSEISDF